MDTQCNP